MEKTLKDLFAFLKSNRQYNKELQTRYYNAIIDPKKNTFENVVSLLYHIANTQSQPKIDKLSAFYKKIYRNKKSLDAFKGFMNVIKPQNQITADYKGVYFGMKSQSGWGDKTSALFSKSIYHLHNNEYP
jgi:hypothetical protein